MKKNNARKRRESSQSYGNKLSINTIKLSKILLNSFSYLITQHQPSIRVTEGKSDYESNTKSFKTTIYKVKLKQFPFVHTRKFLCCVEATRQLTIQDRISVMSDTTTSHSLSPVRSFTPTPSVCKELLRVDRRESTKYAL